METDSGISIERRITCLGRNIDRILMMSVICVMLPFYLSISFQNQGFLKEQALDFTPNVNISIPSSCQLNITAESTHEINSALSNPKTRFVRLNPIVHPYYSDEFWRTKNESDEIAKYFWIWADGDIGRRYLSLPHNFVEMSLWTLSTGVEKINIDLQEVQQGCWVTLNVTEQLYILSSLFLNTAKQYHPQDSLICFNTVSNPRPNRHVSQFAFSEYRCSNVSNVSKMHFTLEERRLSKFYSYEMILIFAAFYFSPVIFVMLLPKRFTVRYSPKWLQKMTNYEISGPETCTPLDELLSLAPENRVSTFIVVFFIFPVAHVPIFFGEYINKNYYADCALSVSPFFWVYFVFAYLLTLYRVCKSTDGYEDLKTSVKTPGFHIVFSCLHGICACEWETPEFDYVCKSFFGEYISLQNVITKHLLSTTNFVKFISFHLSFKPHKPICKYLLAVLLGIFVGLPICVILLFIDLIITVIRFSQNSYFLKIQFGIMLLELCVFGMYFLYVFILFLYDLISLIILTLAGAVLNYDIVLNYIILYLSVLYYIWQPFHDLQEKYHVLKVIAFQECSSHGMKYIKHVQVNSQSSDGSDSQAIPNNGETRDGEEYTDSGNTWATGSIQSSTSEQNNDNVQYSEHTRLLLSNNPATRPYTCNDGKGITSCGNAQATNREQSPNSGQDNEEYVFLYKSDKRGMEIIPKDLWELIYKQLLPFDAGIAKACVTSIAAVLMAFFFMGTLTDFDMDWELQFIGQGVASLITVSIPSLVLGYINTEASKDSLKRSWEAAVREIVKDYIKKNEIPDPGSIG